MKKIFPIISVLVLLSLLGLIFFQFLWLRTARDNNQQELNNNIVKAMDAAAVMLMQEKPPIAKVGEEAPGENPGSLNYSVADRFTAEEVSGIIRKCLLKNHLSRVPFEFAVVQKKEAPNNQMQLEAQLQSDDFFEYFEQPDQPVDLRTSADPDKDMQHFIQLVPPGGSILENMAKDEFLIVIVPNQRGIVMRKITWFILGAIFFTLIITTAFFLTIRALLKQKKLSEIKSDFINNMTHEFKTPLATISLAVDALRNEKVALNPEKSSYFTNIIKEENKRMNKQVETILQAALLDKQEVQLDLKKRSAHDMINAALNNIQLPLQEKNGTLIVNLHAGKDLIMADEVHFTNLINNLLDNALKYSGDKPVIKITTSNSHQNLKIRIEDNGIGMSKETLGRIFEKFYRAHTGNIHNVKGFGLGLSYVKTMVDAHKGNIKAESTLGKGSSFTIQLPLSK